MKSILAMILALAFWAAPAFAEGTADEAKALVKQAVAMIAKDGKDKAFEAIDDPKGPFVKDDLYIFVLDPDAVVLAHGANKALIGKSIKALKTPDGKLFATEMIELAKKSGEGWVDYQWPDPLTKKIANKSSFVVKSGDLTVGCGIYKH